jgi:ABC-2 type transport system permease protein
MRAITPAHAIWLLARLRLQRLFHQITTVKFGSRKSPKTRVATPSKKRLGWLLPLFIMVSMSFSFGNMARQSVLNLQCHLEPSSHCEHMADKGVRQDFMLAAQEVQAAPFGTSLAVGLTMQLSLLFLVSFLLPLGSRDLAQSDWDLEWLATLPVRRSTLLWGRVFERTLANPTGLLVLLPTCAMLAWFSGFRWNAPAHQSGRRFCAVAAGCAHTHAGRYRLAYVAATGTASQCASAGRCL